MVNALYEIAREKKDESLLQKLDSLFKETIEEYGKDKSLKTEIADAFNSWGDTLYNLALKKQEESSLQEAEKYFKEAIGKYDIVIDQNWERKNISYYNRGAAYYRRSLINNNDKKLAEELAEKARESFKKEKKSILNILVYMNDDVREGMTENDFLLPLLDDLKTSDGRFFKEATKNMPQKELNKLDKYKKVYINSMYIISKLHVDNDNEEFVASYREKTISQKMLFEDTKFRLNAIDHSNDPTEGKTLLDYLYEDKPRIKKLKEKEKLKENFHRKYGAFAGCFTFSYDSLNQFRLYGKEDDKEGTGLSLIFDETFFSERVDTAIDQNGNKKHTLFRCIYIDPMKRRVETVGQKEKYLFFRENISEAYDDYHKYIDDIIEKVNKKMEELKDLVNDKKGELEKLDRNIVGQLLINLRYLTKHIAFKEEQECRIVEIHPLDYDRIKLSPDYKQMYIEYEPKVSEHIKEIYFGPKATEIEMFQNLLVHKCLDITCEKSENPLA